MVCGVFLVFSKKKRKNKFKKKKIHTKSSLMIVPASNTLCVLSCIIVKYNFDTQRCTESSVQPILYKQQETTQNENNAFCSLSFHIPFFSPSSH